MPGGDRRLIAPADLGDDPGGVLSERLTIVRERIARAAARRQDARPEVRLVAVTKYVDAEVIRLLHGLGLRDFGESRVQSLAEKTAELRNLAGTRFHLVGHLQRNKARKALECASAIHSLDSARLLEELDAQAARRGRALPELYVEVNVAEEAQKTGLSPEGLPALLRSASSRPAIRSVLRGLMTMAPLTEDPEEARPVFRKLRELRDRCRDEGLLPADADLSMGMSSDFEVAIEEGAGTVRVGRMLYGVTEDSG